MKYLYPTVLASLLALVQTQEHQVPITSHTVKDIPLLGYGTWNLAKSNASEAVTYAIETGYRHIDCAAAYGNEKKVGQGIAHGLQKAGLKRSDIWVTSKLWNDHHAPSQVAEGLEKTLSDLGLEYLDLYLMHWPVTTLPSGKSELGYLETWHAMEKLLSTGKVKHIGVSNFSPEQLRHLISNSKVVPYAHQMELHPYLQQTAFVQFHQAMGVHVTAYSPLGNSNPTYGDPKKGAAPALLENEVLEVIAKEHDCTTAQVALAWGMLRGTSVIPKSQHKERIAENFGVKNCSLIYEDFKEIEKVGAKYLHRFNNPSKSWGVPLYKSLDGV